MLIVYIEDNAFRFTPEPSDPPANGPSGETNTKLAARRSEQTVDEVNYGGKTYSVQGGQKLRSNDRRPISRDRWTNHSVVRSVIVMRNIVVIAFLYLNMESRELVETTRH